MLFSQTRPSLYQLGVRNIQPSPSGMGEIEASYNVRTGQASLRTDTVTEFLGAVGVLALAGAGGYALVKAFTPRRRR